MYAEAISWYERPRSMSGSLEWAHESHNVGDIVRESTDKVEYISMYASSNCVYTRLAEACSAASPSLSFC